MISFKTLPAYVRQVVCDGCEYSVFDDMTYANIGSGTSYNQLLCMASDLTQGRSEITIARELQRYTHLFYEAANKHDVVVLERNDEITGEVHLRMEKAYRIVEIDGHRLLFYLDRYDAFYDVDGVESKYRIRCAVNPSGTIHHGTCSFSPHTVDGVGQMTCHMSADLRKIVEREMRQMWKTW